MALARPVEGIRLIMAHNSSAEFGGYDDAPAYVDSLMQEAGVPVARRELVDSAKAPRALELPKGWQHHHHPEAVTEFDSWTFGRHVDEHPYPTMFVTSALVRTGLTGGSEALARALASDRPCGVYRRGFWPWRAEERWFVGFIATQCFTLPAGWPTEWPLIRYQWSDLDPTWNAKEPFGARSAIPVGIREYSWWWVTSSRSAYTRSKPPTEENLPFIYRKVLAVTNELVLGLREVLRLGDTADGQEAAQAREFRGTLRPVSAASIMATPAETRTADRLGDGSALTRLRLAKLVSRQPIDAALNRILGVNHPPKTV